MKNKAKVEPGLILLIGLLAVFCAMIIAAWVFDISPEPSPLGPEYSYDIEQYAKIDPGLIHYEPVGEAIPLDFQAARAIALGADGKMYIAGDDKVEIHTPGISITIQSVFNGEPTCITVEDDGTILVGVVNTIRVLGTDAKEKARWIVPETNAILTSLAYDKNYVFAADAVNKVVWQFDRQGNVVGQIGKKDEQRNIPGFVIPSPYFDIAMASDGLLRVVNPGRHLIEAYTVNGDREWVWGKPTMGIEGFSGCCNPVNFAILPDGGFVTAEKGLVRVKTYDSDGIFTGVVAGPEQLGWVELMRVSDFTEKSEVKGFDVAVDAQERVYVLDTVRNAVRIFAKKP